MNPTKPNPCLGLVLALVLSTVSAQQVVTLQLPDPCESVTAVYEWQIKTPALSIYPNPTTGKVTLALPETGDLSPLTIGIYSLTGSRLFSFSWDGDAETTIDCAGLPPGMYILSVSGTELKVHQRIIKL